MGIKQDLRGDYLGRLFTEFLAEFASPLRQYVSILGTPHSNYLQSTQTVGDSLYIEDPLERTNNIGRTCFGIHQVRAAFREALEAIRLSSVVSPSQCRAQGWS